MDNRTAIKPTSLARAQLLAALRAFRQGDFSVRLPVDLTGLDGEIADAFNDVVELNERMTQEIERLSHIVGKQGKVGHRAKLPNATGSWATNVDMVNDLIGDMAQPTGEMARVIDAVAKGDLSQRMNLEIEGRALRGEFLRIGKVVNTMLEQLGSFASEVTRVAREVGSEGKLGGQANVRGVTGTWKDLTDNVNAMAANLTGQVRNIAEVTTAVAKGDLSKKITVDVKGEILELKNTINTMVDQLNSFASEVTRVAREVGTDGKLGGQACVDGAAGTWKDLTDNVNAMAANLTGQVRNIAEVTTAVAKGDLSKKITVDVKGEILKLKNTVNTMVDQLNSFASEVTRVAGEVGTEGKLGGQAKVPGVAGTWKDLTDNVNTMAANLTGQVRNIAGVTTAVANGDLSKKITVNVKGEILELKNTINTMVDQLNSFASEVTRVAREVGTQGQLGGQAKVDGVAGTWKDLTDNVNTMAANLTGQVRNIAAVVTEVAQGNLRRKLTVDSKGEIASLGDTINGMIETLAIFAEQVTNVAREVGIEGKLGGQARVPGAAGIWRDLTDNVNQLADNLTTQVRAIAEASDAVTKGDLSRSITVEASGEVAALKDNINQMIRNLVQAQKMEAVGQLTGGIAHDFNNLLTVILGNIDLLRRKLGNDHLERHLSATRHAAERGQSLTQQLLAFSRRQHLQPQTLDVNALVRQFAPLIRRAVGESIALEVALCHEPLVCEVDPSELESALLNLAVNSRDAMPSGGTLTVTLKRIERDDDLVRQNHTASPGPWIVLSLEDTGIGMSKEVVDRAFEPFFTTKEPGKGSGLGLSRVYGFVRQSGGFLTLASTVGIGTRLSIYLPPSTKSLSEQVSVDQLLAAPAARTETILLVEDDSAVLALVIEMLNDLGYRVITASDAHGALEIVRRGEPIDLILTDVVMPGGKTGVHLAAEARALRPDIKILLMSGYPGEALARHEPADIEWPMIEKPFRQPELASRLQSLLDGRLHALKGSPA